MSRLHARVVARVKVISVNYVSQRSTAENLYGSVRRQRTIRQGRSERSDVTVRAEAKARSVWRMTKAMLRKPTVL